MIRSRRVVVAGIFSLAVLSPCLQAAAQGKKYRFGFSQVTTLEPWRVQFNKDMRAEAAKHPQVELVIADAGDRTDKQVADMDNFIAQKMDVIWSWKQDKAYEYMKTMLRRFPKIDVVYAQNDPMAYGAYLAAKDLGRANQIRFVGADALPQEGATWVLNGELAATFLYPTPGAEGIRQALKMLKGEKIAKKVILDTEGVFPDNAKAFIAAH